MSTLFQMSAYLLLMPALVVLAANLLFEEQDNDTLKNLMTVPASKSALAMAKMALLFLFSIAFMAVGAWSFYSSCWPPGGSRLVSGGSSLWHRPGDHDVAGALPCILLVVLLNRSYIISVIVTFFYTAVNYIFGLSEAFTTQPFGLNLGTLLPGPLTFRWYFSISISPMPAQRCWDFWSGSAPISSPPPRRFW